MAQTIKGKTAIVTGAGSGKSLTLLVSNPSKTIATGINLEFARLLLRGGCNCVIADLSLRPEAEVLVKEYPNSPKAIFQKTDVTSWKDLDAMMKAAEDNFGQIDIVCPGAGVFEPHWSNFWYPPGTAESRDSADGNRYSLLDINITHPIRVTQLAIPYFLKNGASPSNPKTIVHIASIAGESASLPVPMYHASKWAIHGFVRSLGDLEAKYGIRVAAVLPGVVKTPLWTDNPEKSKAFNEEKDVWVTPEEVAGVMLAIVEKDQISGTVTGQAGPYDHADEIKIMGGSCLEVSSGKVRDVPMFNNSGPSGIVGNDISNVAELYNETFELIKPGSNDAYTIDYHEALLGQPQSHTTFFHKPQSSSNASLLYTVSDKAVLGAINPKDGAVLWRQFLSPTGPVINATSKSFLVAGEGDGQVTSAYGNSVRTWDTLDGKLIWEHNLGGDKIVHSLQAVRVLGETNGQGGQTQDLIVLAGSLDGKSSSVVRLAGDGSGVRWEHTEERSDTPVAIYVTEREVYYVSSAGGLLGGKTKVASLDVVTGKEQKLVNPSFNSEVLTGDVDGAGMSCAGFPFVVTSGVNPSGARYKDITVNVLGSNRVYTLDLERKREDILGLSVHYACDTKAVPHFLVHVRGKTQQWGEVFHINSENSNPVSKSYVLPATEENSVFAASSIDSTVYFTRITDSEVVVYSSVSHGVLGRWPRRGGSPPGLHAAAEVVSRGKTLAVRIAMTSRFGVWSLIRNGELQWVRPEILAYVTDAAWADGTGEGALASELEAEESANPLTAYLLRVRRHTEELMLDLPQYLMSLPQSFAKKTPAHVDPKSSMLGNKLLITATSRHQVVAVDAVTGDIEWMKDFSFFAMGGSHIASLVVQDGHLWVYRSDGSYSVLDTFDGSTIEHKPASTPADKVVAIPGLPGATIIKISDGTPQLSAEAPSSAIEGNSILTIHPVHGANGWTVGQSVYKTWTIKPSTGAQIVNAVSRPPHDPVASIGKVLGDRSVLYKYLSPNLALLTALSSTTLTIYLIEAVTGTILHTSTHEGIESTSPIPSVMSENWFACSFTTRHPSTSAVSTQIVISELYESAFPNDRGTLPTTANYSTFSADALHPPHIISQSYIVSEPISHMSVTQTAQGITSRSLLATLPNSGAIIGIPLHMLNARRPVDRDPTPLEMEEGLIRYSPYLELAPIWYLTHAREVIGIEKVTSTPSLLESTSLVVGYGHDLFGTRVSPSMAFDVLDKGFNKVSLLLTIAGLAIATAALAPLVRRKQVEGRWKI